MFNTNSNNSIFGLTLLGIFALALAFPTIASAQYGNYYNSGGSYGTGGGNDNNPYYPPVQTTNPVPYINSITPDNVTAKPQIIRITLNGSGFIHSSTVRYDGSPRTVIYISPTRLVVQLNEADVSTPGRRYITVVNDMPGGGFSNPIPFVVNQAIATAGTTSQNTTNNSNYGASALSGYENMNTSSGENYGIYGNEESYRSLTANALVGSRGFLPNGLLQWIILIIVILAIVFVWRKFFGSEKKYHSTPMKHA